MPLENIAVDSENLSPCYIGRFQLYTLLTFAVYIWLAPIFGSHQHCIKVRNLKSDPTPLVDFYCLSKRQWKKLHALMMWATGRCDPFQITISRHYQIILLTLTHYNYFFQKCGNQMFAIIYTRELGEQYWPPDIFTGWVLVKQFSCH